MSARTPRMTPVLALDKPAAPPSGGFLDVRMVPVLVLDYVWVILIYATIAFWLAVLIDGYILPKYDQASTDATPSWLLFIELVLQLGLQGFIAVFIHTLLNKLPSPAQGLRGYSRSSPEWVVIRNPAVISVILFALSNSMRGRLMTLFKRFDRNEV
jgi:hypothetical protein